MIDSAKGELLQRKADEIYQEAKDLRDFDRVRVFDRRLSEIDDPQLRAGVEALAFSKLQLGIGVQSAETNKWNYTYLFSKHLVDIFIFILSAAISYVEFQLSFLTSLAVGLGIGLSYQLVMVLIYPRYPYGRLFALCLTSGIALIAPSSFEIEFKYEFARLLWGAPPSNGLIAIYLVCIILSAILAFVELRHSQKK